MVDEAVQEEEVKREAEEDKSKAEEEWCCWAIILADWMGVGLIYVNGSESLHFLEGERGESARKREAGKVSKLQQVHKKGWW